MQDHSGFDARYNMGLNPENRFCRLSVHCAPRGGAVWHRDSRISGRYVFRLIENQRFRFIVKYVL